MGPIESSRRSFQQTPRPYDIPSNIQRDQIAPQPQQQRPVAEVCDTPVDRKESERAIPSIVGVLHYRAGILDDAMGVLWDRLRPMYDSSKGNNAIGVSEARPELPDSTPDLVRSLDELANKLERMHNGICTLTRGIEL